MSKIKSRMVGFLLMFVNFLLIRYFLSGYLRSVEVSFVVGVIASFCYALAYLTFGYANDYILAEVDTIDVKALQKYLYDNDYIISKLPKL